MIGSCVFAAAVIFGAYYLSRSIEHPDAAQASAESGLLEAVATKDSDGDGLPDWQESLYGTDPHKTDSLGLGMTDGQAVAKGLIVPKAVTALPGISSAPVSYDANGLPPASAGGTLTAAFTQNFINLYLAARQANGGNDLTDAQIQSVAAQSIQSLGMLAAAAPDYKKVSDIRVDGSGGDAMRAYAVDAQNIIATNRSGTSKNEVSYLKDAVEKGDTAALSSLSAIAKSYRTTAVGFAQLSAPVELGGIHLRLINSLMRLSEVINDMSRVNDDPLATIIALEQYPNVVQSFWSAMDDVGKAYRNAGVTVSVKEPGGVFVNLASHLAAQKP